MTTVTVPAVGEQIAPFVRTTGPANWNRFAAVNDEFIPIHMDDDAGRAAGQSGAFGMGNLQVSYLHAVLREWIGPDGRIRALACQFRGINTKGMAVTARGRVREITREDGATVVELDVWTEDQDGGVLAPGQATVVLPVTVTHTEEER